MSENKENIVPVAPAVGPNAARVTVNREAPGGGARAIADQPGVSPDYPYQGTPPAASPEPIKEAPKYPGPSDSPDEKLKYGVF